MPKSQQPMEGERIIVERILRNPDRNVLDVGCGEGKWSDLLFEKIKRLDGIEIWRPCIEKYGLERRYDQVYNADVTKFSNFRHYDVVILGDVLEHLRHENAVALIGRLKDEVQDTYLTVPISFCEQNGTVYENPYETHQYQWTHEELVQLGFEQLHRGPNPNGLVMIGTYHLGKNVEPPKATVDPPPVRVSVIVPAYIRDEQGKAYLKECLDSIGAQTFKNFECIAVDDCSPVEIRELVEGHGFRYHRNEENQGIGYVRAKGVELAEGEYVSFLSHDDKWHPDFLKTMMAHAREGKILYTNYYNIDPSGNVVSGFTAPRFEHREDFVVACQAWAERDDMFTMFSGLLIPKAVFEKVPIDPTLRIGEDLKFTLMASKLFEFRHIDAWLVFYRRHGAQETLKYLSKIRENNERIRLEVREWWKK